jgi:hypothetical protein
VGKEGFSFILSLCAFAHSAYSENGEWGIGNWEEPIFIRTYAN